MAMTAMEFDLEESDVLFGMDEIGDERCEDDDDDDVIEKLQKEEQNRTLPRVESCGKNEFSNRSMTIQRRCTPQSRSMPATSSGYLLQEVNRWRRNNQLDRNEEINEEIMESLSMETDSDTISIPRQQKMMAIPIQSSAPHHWRRRSTEENDDNQFVPPHQMIERDCFSLGMKHYFKHKPGNI